VDSEFNQDAWSPELRAFVYSCIDSVEQVQVLVLLGSSERPWTARLVAQEMSLSDHAARHHLESMAARGLVAVTVSGDAATWRYAPKSDTLRRLGDELVAAYQRSPMAVIRLVATNARPSIRSISDAFRLRDRR
jgi:hypothetical protein